ncbi:MAG: MarR family winged helix-turn-helix transcriptional regulator [Oscillospiraceae bacterium]
MATLEQTEFVIRHLRELQPAEVLGPLSEGDAGAGAVLRLLYESSANITAGEISARMHVSTARVAVLLRNMSAKGLIEEEADRRDGRLKMVRLSPAGRQKARQIHERVCAEAAAVIDKVGMDKIQQLLLILDEIKAAAGPGP